MSDATVRAVELFEFYVRHVWPVHRPLAKHRIARRCRRCAASERMLPLGADGLCRECLDYQSTPRAANQEDVEALARILHDHEDGPDRTYDALVLYSGGKDSTYLIQRIRNEHPKLRLLAFTIDNGFMSPVARSNVQELIVRLDVDHVFIKPRRSFYVRLFRYCLTHLNDQGGYGTLDFSDGEFMLDTARRLAAEKRIPLILCGYSRYQVENGLGLHRFESPRSRELSDRVETAGLALKDIFSSEEIALWWHASRWPESSVARLLFPLYAWDLEEAEIKDKVVQWNLQTAHQSSPAITNHLLIPLIGVTDVHQLGYSSFEIEFCRMIREGKADRQQWQPTFEFLEYTARTGVFVKKPVTELAAQLELTLEDLHIRFQ